jgi:hypothetical protein
VGLTVPPSPGTPVQAHRGRIMLIGKHPHAHASTLVTDPLQLLDERASHTAPAKSLHDGDLVQEEFGPLIGVEYLDGGHEPGWSIMNVAEQQMMPFIVEESASLVGEHNVVERILEPSDLGFIPCARTVHVDVSIAQEPLRSSRGSSSALRLGDASRRRA